jgi:type II secretory pathway component GspD/PulD (secretin)
VDPRVRADVTVIGQNTANVSYPELLTILQVHGFAAVEGGGYVQVIPDTLARALATPTAFDRNDFADAQFVSRIIEVKSVPATLLVPILRPLLPQNAHLTAFSCRNTLLMVDTHANVKRIEAIVQALDKGAPFQPEKCASPALKSPAPPKDAAAH